MRKVLLTIAMIALACAVAAGIASVPKETVKADGDIEINETNFPDENFRNWILNQEYGKDGKLTTSEIVSIKSLDVSFVDISNIKGIEYFTELVELDCSQNRIYSLDLSKNTALETLYCYKNGLESLDVSKNTALTTLSCSYNHLTSLDVSKNIALTVFYCSGNQLTSLDVSKNTALTSLGCDANELTSLDVSKNTALIELFCSSNKLTSLDVSKNTVLDILGSEINQIKTIYVAREEDTYSGLYYDNGVKVIVLTESDWNSKVEWKVNESDPSKTTATALFECTKAGATDYKVSEPMNVKITSSVAATCEKDGSVSLEATLPAELSRTGKAISDAKTIKIPATGHTWGEWTVTKKATFTEEGEETRICKNDPTHKETRKIAKLTPTAKPANNATLTLNKKALTVVCGKTDSLKATLKGATSKITWKSSDKKIATVDANGKITTKQAGAVTITATAAGKSASCEVTVLYKDVTNTKDFWYAPTNYLTAKGVVKGYDKQTKFKPANECTRAQMVTFIWRLVGEPAPKTKTCKFKDVKSSDYYYKACIWGNENHIVEGYKDGTFGPKIVCARKHAVTFLWRLAGQPKPSSSKNKFKDVKEKDYYYKACLWASEKGILAGYSDGTFRPNGDCLRRQMVTFLYKYDKFVNGKG